MKVEQKNLLDLLDPRKTTTPIKSLPTLSAVNLKDLFNLKKYLNCSTQMSEKTDCSSENNLTTKSESQTKPTKDKITAQQSKPRHGDWLCLICGNHNYSFRESCNRCQKQTKTQNFDQSLQIYGNPALKNSLMKNQAMAERIEFNFCFSIQSGIKNVKQERTINMNVVPNMPNKPIFPHSSHNSNSFNKQNLSPAFYRVNHPFSPIDERQNFFPNGSQSAQNNYAVNNQNHFYSPYANYSMTSDQNSQHRSPLNMNNQNYYEPNRFLSKTPNPHHHFGFAQQNNKHSFKKDTINSDNCHDKTSSRETGNMQRNLEQKFKEMSLTSTVITKPVRCPFTEIGNSNNTPNDNNYHPNTFNNRKKQHKRKTKLKYKAVTACNKENSLKNRLKRKEDLKKKALMVNIEFTKEQKNCLIESSVKEEDVFMKKSSNEKSPRKSYFKSIFNSKLLFDFETPKKQKNDCFLNLNNFDQDSDFKKEMQFSARQNKILKLFSQSDDEENLESSPFELKENIFSNVEINNSLQKMSQQGFNKNLDKC